MMPVIKKVCTRIIILCFFICYCDCIQKLRKTAVIATKYGQLRGVHKILPENGLSVATYLGVPYATPPAGGNRFSPTRTLSQWVGIHEATSFGPSCPQRLPDIRNETEALSIMSLSQLRLLQRSADILRHQSEDCLYLNIYVPKLIYSKNTGKLPVMVFVHGHSYEWGSSSLYDGSFLASRGKIIVVTINYRLGILGFFNPNVNVAGRATVANYGLMDQLAALHWVQENIAGFGGDPAQVTVMGHGTGAACLNFLIISPASAGAGLFKRAILMSGSALNSRALVENPSHYAVKVAVQLACDIPDEHSKYYEALLHCLRNRTVEQITKINIETPKYKSSIGPSIDGVTIKPNWKEEMAKMGEENQTPVDILLGVTELDKTQTFTEKEIQSGFDINHRDKLFRTYVTNNYRFHLQEILLAITAEYTDWTRPIQHQTTIRDITAQAIHDAMMVAPMSAVAEQLHSDGKNTFIYVLRTNHPSHSSKEESMPITDEIPLIFGSPLSAINPNSNFKSTRNYTKAHSYLSETMMKFWTNFIKHGNPDLPDIEEVPLQDMSDTTYRSPPWDPYDRIYQRYLELGPSRGRSRDHFRALRVALWNWLVPNLERVGARYGPDSLFHRLPDYNLPETFAGPTRPWSISPYLAFTTTPSFTTSTRLPTGFITATAHLPASPPLPPRDVTAPLETPPSNESDFYTTALGVTIAIGCSLLILNILAFLAIYHRSNSREIKYDSEVPLRGEQPEIITDSTDGKPMVVHSFKIPSPHRDVIHSPSITTCDGDIIREWPPNYSTCCIAEMPNQQDLQPNMNNGSSTLRRQTRSVMGRSVSMQGHDEPIVYHHPEPLEDPQNYSEMRL